jgi:hypothetical protein
MAGQRPSVSSRLQGAETDPVLPLVSVRFLAF